MLLEIWPSRKQFWKVIFSGRAIEEATSFNSLKEILSEATVAVGAREQSLQYR
jgi:hypothetical protein